MYGRFTRRAQRVMTLSQNEAKRLNHNHIGTEHLLLGLLRESEGIAGKALGNMGVDLKIVEDKINNIGAGYEIKQDNIEKSFAYTSELKAVIEIAIEEASQMGKDYVGTEHLLLGVLTEGEISKDNESIAVMIFKDMNISLQSTRDEVMRLVKGYNESNDERQSKEQKFEKFNNKFNDKGMKNKPALKKASALDSFGIDLTALAKEGKLDPTIGREKEIERVVQILSRRTKNNPCIIGEPGVGKTAIAEGIAQKIVNSDVPVTIEGKRVVTLELSSIIAGTKYRGEFEERLKNIVDEVVEDKNVILFIDELHNVVGAGGAEGAIDASNILKPTLARGELQCIGATTMDEYRKNFERDSALERRFQPIMIDEPGTEESTEVLKGLRDRYEAHHEVEITDEAIDKAVKLSNRYITSRYLPDKAIDLIDEAASSVKLFKAQDSVIKNDLEDNLKDLQKQKENAVNDQDYETAAKLRDEEDEIIKERDFESEKLQVTGEDIAGVVSDWTGIPVNKLTREESEQLLDMEESLHKCIVGQGEAVKAVSSAIRRARAGLKDPKRPIGSFIFLGPTGVGKSELAKTLAEVLFADKDAVIRLDMSEYMESHTTSKLVGSPPGYIGHEEGGQLTEKVRRRPYSVILFDEIEKAHPEVFNTLLQVLEDGRLTDSKGKTVDFKNTVMIMTSNVGAHLINNIKGVNTLGFKINDHKDSKYEDMKDKVMEQLKNTFKPEFLNRIDETIVFHSLEKEHLKTIVGIMLAELLTRIKDFDITLEITPEAKTFLAEKGYDPTYGARPLRRAIQKNLEDSLSEKILKGEFGPGDKVIVDVKPGNGEKELTFYKEEEKVKS